jgi:hypothetical protein
MQELKLMVPTYIGNSIPQPVDGKVHRDFASPYTPILLREADGVRIVLGTHDYEDHGKPDIQIERRPNGWAVFLHPSGGDPSGYVYLLDDGRSFVVPEFGLGAIEVLGPDDEVPELDRSNSHTAAEEIAAESPMLIKTLEARQDMGIDGQA